MLLLLVAVAVVLVALAVRGQPPPATAPPPAPPPEPPLDVTLTLAREEVAISQGGVLVVPLVLGNAGTTVQVRTAIGYAEPVVDDVVVQEPTVVQADSARRFVVLLAPDCRLLRPGSPLRFAAGVLLRVGAGARTQELVLDLDELPQVRDAVEGLCA